MRTKHSEEQQRAAQIAQSLHMAEERLAASAIEQSQIASIQSAAAEATEASTHHVAMLQAQIVNLEMRLVEEQQRVVTVSDELTQGAEVRE